MATIAETAVTKWDLVGINHVLVPEGSWRVAGCQKYMASEADHFSVCKPTSKTSNNYINFLRNIEDLPIARPVPEAVVRLIVFKEDTFKKSVPSVDLYSLEDLKEQLENAPVEFKTRLVDSSEILTELVRLLSKEGWDDGWDADGRIRATTAYILYYLARVEKLRAQIGLYPKALRRLLHLLHMNVGELRKAALYALHVLARDGPSAAAICRREGALDHLVLLMISQKDKDLRVKAATTLAFATDKRRENQNSFLDLERAYKILVRILEEEQSPNLLYSAAHALANVPEYYSELAQQPQSLLTLAKLLEGNRRESKEQNEEEMVHRINIATIFQGITAGGANARHIATCKGVLENMVRVLQVTEDNPRPLQLSIVKSLHNISKEDYYLLKRIANFRVSRWLSRLEENLELTNMDAKFYISSLWQGLESMRFSCVGDQYEFGDEGVFTVKIEFYSQRGTNSQFRPYHSRTLEEEQAPLAQTPTENLSLKTYKAWDTERLRQGKATSSLDYAFGCERLRRSCAFGHTPPAEAERERETDRSESLGRRAFVANAFGDVPLAVNSAADGPTESAAGRTARVSRRANGGEARFPSVGMELGVPGYGHGVAARERPTSARLPTTPREMASERLGAGLETLREGRRQHPIRLRERAGHEGRRNFLRRTLQELQVEQERVQDL
ncbi:hypothetical protein AXG93_838s1030 [Marchantia polymorpha subsp. ruderalis]|uniref:Uncharacterized protein n=1 Tax=Marchantia polymorpha subsp. ruderalis TaxID=1480154 RepID=A0A176WSB3_MARPO|nr:hypothetical protein AXG93_838s1030 [Marchantia polymorpha subsp. ruderalis]